VLHDCLEQTVNKNSDVPTTLERAQEEMKGYWKLQGKESLFYEGKSLSELYPIIAWRTKHVSDEFGYFSEISKVSKM
jgi:hypothetical protein